MDCKEIKLINPKGNLSWIFIGRTDAEAKTPILWPPDAKNWLLEKTLMLGKIEGRRRRGRQRMRWLDGIMTRWIWVWASSGRWWWGGNPGMLQSMGLQRIGHDWATELTKVMGFILLFYTFKRVMYHWRQSPRLLKRKSRRFELLILKKIPRRELINLYCIWSISIKILEIDFLRCLYSINKNNVSLN